MTLTNTNSVNGATNVKASDVSDYGDGRDLQVSFTRAQNESNVSNYRVFVVKRRMQLTSTWPQPSLYPAKITQR